MNLNFRNFKFWVQFFRHSLRERKISNRRDIFGGMENGHHIQYVLFFLSEIDFRKGWFTLAPFCWYPLVFLVSINDKNDY